MTRRQFPPLSFGLMVLGILILIGCTKDYSPDYHQDYLNCSSELIKCKSELKEEEIKWGYEYECDKWKETGNTLFRDTDDCIEYVLLEDGQWMDYSIYWEIGDKCMDDDWNESTENCKEYYRLKGMRFNMLKDICRQEPYQEKKCTHKKVVGLKEE